ncbi:MAG: hypothetical protein JO250_13045, partial [Armatimonadetes bacterium]|nr:hypothetical protein [Armatimonadota bacterium]
NLLRLWQESSLLLDGREHGRAVTRWGGTSSLFPGQTWSFTVTPIEYLPQAYACDQAHERRPGPDALAPGRHTLLLKFGGKVYGPARFIREKPTAPCRKRRSNAAAGESAAGGERRANLSA